MPNPSLRAIARHAPFALGPTVLEVDRLRNRSAPLPAPPPLVPLIGAEDDMTPALERTLHPIAVRAHRGDREARDALYRAFEPKLMRFVRRIRVPFGPQGAKTIWERDDVIQEGYLVFAALLEGWSPVIPFGRYVLANFPWRLRDAVRRGVARRTVPPHLSVMPIDLITSADTSTLVLEQEVLIAALATMLEPPLDAILRLHVLERLSLSQVGIRLGISRRTMTRHWQAILIRLRATDPAERPVPRASARTGIQSESR